MKANKNFKAAWLSAMFALGAAALVLALARDLWTAAALAAAYALGYILAIRPKLGIAVREERDAYEFLRSLIGNSAYYKSTITAIKISLNPRFVFYRGLSDAVSKYEMYNGIDHEIRFETGSALLRSTLEIANASLASGISMSKPLASLEESYRSMSAHSRRMRATLGNTLSITALSSAVFLPAFAGISINILRFTGASGYPASVLFYATATYIILVNYISFAFSRGKERLPGVFKAVLLSIFGVISMDAAALMAANIIGV
ncbi:MAG: hypothetical protein LVQ97_00460 [Candidatus Micrarchaeales archaeon]|jgi:hypothetical protein|uniref:Uncharacterized protein n=1 Tax=Candidatus Micrarchaeum acidiphilum ARMAN-2 TaxID=425595 RepID=C7DHH4_MICA2|nr:MAG: hypothetical protein UNLARM2_0518 [Candidatus Micrarchaeum acidiphilum ARMAN-2]MCW6160645.1 hypothetical protein [Candidatus Micrarchaeales archaeon]